MSYVMPEQRPKAVPQDARAGLALLIHNCPTCSGHARVPCLASPFMAAGDCPTCGPVRKWLFDTFGFDYEAKT